MMLHSFDTYPPTLTAYLEADELESFGRAGDAYARLVDCVDDQQATCCVVMSGTFLHPGPAVAVLLPKRRT